MTTECYQKTQKDRERYQNFADEEKEKKKHQYHCERNKNLSREQKQKLVGYRRQYYKTHNK